MVLKQEHAWYWKVVRAFAGGLIQPLPGDDPVRAVDASAFLAGLNAENAPRAERRKRRVSQLAIIKRMGRKRDPLWDFDCAMLPEFPVLCGVDEVGRGPLAGNVVAACVILDFHAQPIKGLNDSKKLTEAVREELNAEIRARAIAFGVGECSRKKSIGTIS